MTAIIDGLVVLVRACPQSFQFWNALKALGIPTQLAVYPDEGHLIQDPEHRRDIIRRMATWFDQYLY